MLEDLHPLDLHGSCPRRAYISILGQHLVAVVAKRSSGNLCLQQKQSAYKFEPIGLCMQLDEFVDIPVDHPFGYHCKLVVCHCHSKKRQYIPVVKSLPRYYLPAKPL